jgi:hypothetical protein
MLNIEKYRDEIKKLVIKNDFLPGMSKDGKLIECWGQGEAECGTCKYATNDGSCDGDERFIDWCLEDDGTEKAKNSCEGCRYSGDASFSGMKVCTECCNNYYNKWTAKKTRQSEFLKMFPNARLGEYEFGQVLVFDPCDIDESIEVELDGSCTRLEKYGDCGYCKMAYWNEEVE